MASDTGVTGDGEIGNTKQALIAPLVQKELAFTAILLKFFTDVSMYAVEGAKTIDFPKMSSFTVANREQGVAGVPQQITTTLDQLALSFNAYVSWIIDAMTLKQSNIPAQITSAKRAAAAQARYVDTQIIVKIRAICSNFQNVGTDADVTYANCVAMSVLMETAFQSMTDCVWLCSPKQKGVLMGLDEFKRADVYGVGNIPSGVIGYILGAPVVVHGGLAAKELFLAHKESLVYGFQSAPAYGEESDIDYGVGAKKAAIDQLFGVAGQQLAQAGAASGKSPLVLGLND